jgi:hypothetical protein
MARKFKLPDSTTPVDWKQRVADKINREFYRLSKYGINGYRLWKDSMGLALPHLYAYLPLHFLDG